MTNFREFCYLNSSCIRKSITLMFICLWVPRRINSRFCSKTRMGTSMASPYKSLYTWVKHVFRYLVYEIFLWPESWRGSLHIYLLSFLQSVRPGNSLSRGQILPCKRSRWSNPPSRGPIRDTSISRKIHFGRGLAKQDKTRHDKTMLYLQSYTVLCTSTLTK